jgi:hypothetical protein
MESVMNLTLPRPRAVRRAIVLYMLAHLLAGAGGTRAFAQPDAASHARPDSLTRDVVATRVNPHTPAIDGRLDDECWAKARAVRGFLQHEPDETQPSRQMTEARVMYDDAALYVAVMAHDTAPDKIVRQLTRRDEDSESDWILLTVDPFHDKRTGYFFAVNASGVKRDAYVFNDGDMDQSWDAVWDAAVNHGSNGWSAEFRIPFSQLRFPPQLSSTWGFGVWRYISRDKETSTNFLWRKSDSGLMSLQGTLSGLEGLHPPRSIEILPYTVLKATRSITSAGRTLYAGTALAGVDVKYGLTPAYTLNATIHPDFGQVEADPAVLNLGPYETFFPEKRPFFLEGAKVFDTSGISLDGGPGFLQFYSRRIGREPILSAGKITGKSSAGTTVGVLSAVTSTTPFFDWVGDRFGETNHGATGDYEVVRVQQDILGNGSAVGLLATRAARPERDPSETVGLDVSFKAHKQMFTFNGQAIGSWATIDGRVRPGHALVIDGWKLGGKHIKANLTLRHFSRDLRLNDLGYLRRSDLQRAAAWLQWRHDKPGKLLRNYRWNVSTDHQWTTSGIRLNRELNSNFQITTPGYWSAGVGGGFGLHSYDDRETRGAWVDLTPDAHWMWGYVSSDSRKKLTVNLSPSTWANAGGSYGITYSVSLDWRPTTNATLSFYPTYDREHSNAQWVENLDDTTSVFSRLDSHTLDLTMRASLTLTPALSVQLYTQPFVAAGHYAGFKTLARPYSYAFDPLLDYAGNPDFNDRSLRGNLVVRWEYRPGSTLYVVWSEAREEDADTGTFVPLADVAHAVTAPGDGAVQVKLTYWLGG